MTNVLGSAVLCIGRICSVIALPANSTAWECLIYFVGVGMFVCVCASVSMLIEAVGLVGYGCPLISITNIMTCRTRDQQQMLCFEYFI